MPRQARKHAESGIYHVMLRGINQQQVFEGEEDNEQFLWILKECKEHRGRKPYDIRTNHIVVISCLGKDSLSGEDGIKRCG